VILRQEAPQMPPSRKSLLLAALAALFLAATVFYTGISIYYYSFPMQSVAHLGIDWVSDDDLRGIVVTRVAAGSAAEEAGLRVNDVVLAINGRRLDTLNPFYDAVYRGSPGDLVRLTVRRPTGGPPLEVRAELEARERPPENGLAAGMAQAVMRFYPVPATLVGFAVLLLRLRDRHAWLLALLFGGLVTGALPELEPLIHPSLRAFTLGYAVLFGGIWPAVFYALLAIFPAPSRLDRRLPWLKTALLAGTTLVYAPLAVWCFVAGSTTPASRFINRVGGHPLNTVLVLISLGAAALAFVSLALNCGRAVSADVRRKARLLGWTFAVGSLPWLVLVTTAFATGRDVFALSFWLWAPCVLLLMLLPVMFGYAVLRHRVMEFSVLVRRSARYVLVQRGFVLLTAALSIGVTALFAVYGAALLPRLTSRAALPVGIGVGALFGLLVVRTGGVVARRVERHIDRAFFREAYDARQVLEELSQKARCATSRETLASLLETEIKDALHPQLAAVYLKAPGGTLDLACGPESAPRTLSPAVPLLETVARSAQPWSVPHVVGAGTDLVQPLAMLEPECLVRLVDRQDAMTGLIVLGPRLSEEPYSRDDKRLLASVADQAGLALESLVLAEQMAGRIEAERRAAQEVAIAGEVQRRLLPQKAVRMATIDYAGGCWQARTVGGDYYDFLDLGPGHLGLVLADVSGKGLYAALLMANLQANLRSLSARAAGDLASALESVNRSFCESTAGNHFATLFVGHYDDCTRRFRYANCGHCPPFLLRPTGEVERLAVTASAVGMFEPWTCETRDLDLQPGDLLGIFSDGVTDAMDTRGEEFGESRLLAVLRAHRGQAASAVLDGTLAAVLDFSTHEQHDDITLVVARGR
jgi:sigma-B regulation protein RsbU (phosphoserine phosphatase)